MQLLKACSHRQLDGQTQDLIERRVVGDQVEPDEIAARLRQTVRIESERRDRLASA
ncbi:MAG: hypothetical protein IPI02_24385 [Sterolibacteriaceae bacterium]|nr:hypothetical protein [Sterolibacteriaceae bacterium]